MNTTKILALRKPLLISACLLAMQGAAYAQNPIVQTQLTTDPAPLVVGDRLYVYTGHDEDKADFFWMNEWRVYSTKDMVNWTDHGSPLDLSSFSWADDRAWAAQTIERNGKYYWYICAHSKLTGGMAIGVAVADSPTGPFKDALGKPLFDNGSWDNIDPTVWMDEDGQAYLYWPNPLDSNFFIELVVKKNSYCHSYSLTDDSCSCSSCNSHIRHTIATEN